MNTSKLDEAKKRHTVFISHILKMDGTKSLLAQLRFQIENKEIRRNVGNYLPVKTASRQKITGSSSSPFWYRCLFLCLFVFLALQPFWLYFPQPRSGL